MTTYFNINTKENNDYLFSIINHDSLRPQVFHLDEKISIFLKGKPKIFALPFPPADVDQRITIYTNPLVTITAPKIIADKIVELMKPLFKINCEVVDLESDDDSGIDESETTTNNFMNMKVSYPGLIEKNGENPKLETESKEFENTSKAFVHIQAEYAKEMMIFDEFRSDPDEYNNALELQCKRIKKHLYTLEAIESNNTALYDHLKNLHKEVQNSLQQER